MSPIHHLTIRAVDRPIYAAIESGLKTVETRAATPKYRAIQVGDTLVFKCGDDSLSREVSEVAWFPSLDALLDTVPLSTILPDVPDREQARAVWHSFPSYEEKIAQYGILTFTLV